MEKRWIWPFELLDKLGEGGMGVVYRARYVVDNRHVAVKLLPPNVANETILSRFERELEILKTLRHPNIVRCFGGVCEGKQHFYAMELVEGGTLDKLLEERKRFSADQVVQLALQMASGLSYAHERGVVHRDVKPGNFLITPNGKIKLSDFGLATVAAAAKITAAGKTMGTFPYMAPEQIRGRPPVTAQTDLYAFGCVLFELLTGRTPFVGDTPAEVMHKHLETSPPRVTELAPGCPSGLESLIGDLLRKDPTERPESAYAVAERLLGVAPAPHGSTKRSVEVTTPTPRGIPIPEGILSATRAGVDRNWVVPVLGALLALSLFWNVYSLQFSRTHKTAEDLWVAALRSDQPQLREEAAKSLGTLGKSSPPTIDALISTLSDARPAVRQSAIDALMIAGNAARPATAELIHLRRRDESEEVRQKAGVALQKLEGAPSGSSVLFSILFWLFLGAIVAALVVLIMRNRSASRPPGNGR